MDGKELTYDDAVEEIAKRYGVPKSVYSRMVGQESGGDDAAISPKGATSRWQIMPGTARGLGIDPSDPLQAAEGGLRLLRDNYKRFRKQAKNEKHAWMMAVAGYHGNPANVEKDLKAGGYGLPMISDGSITTRDHVLKIFDGITSDTLDRNPFGTATAVKPVNPLAPRSFGQPSDVPVPEVKIEAGQPQPMQMATPENVAKLGLQFATPENMKALKQPTPQAAPEEKGGAIVTPTVQGQKPLVQPPDLNAPIQTPVNTPPPVPETADTLVAQRDAAHDPRSTRIGVMYPKGTPVPPVNDRETLVKLPDGGAIIANSKKLQGYLRQNRIMRAQIEQGRVDYTPLLGGKADVTTNTANKPVVVTRDARTGKELVASTVERPESVPVETQLQQAQFPNQPTTTEVTDSDEIAAQRIIQGGFTKQRPEDQQFQFEQTGIAGNGLKYLGVSNGQYFAQDTDGDLFTLQATSEGDVRWTPMAKFPKRIKFGDKDYMRSGDGRYKDPTGEEYFVEKSDTGYSRGRPVIDRRTPEQKAIDAEFEEWAKVNGRDVERFTAERQVKHEAEFVGKYPKYGEWLKKTGTAFGEASWNAFNKAEADEWLAKQPPAYRKFAQDNRLDPFSDETGAKFNEAEKQRVLKKHPGYAAYLKKNPEQEYGQASMDAYNASLPKGGVKVASVQKVQRSDGRAITSQPANTPTGRTDSRVLEIGRNKVVQPLPGQDYKGQQIELSNGKSLLNVSNDPTYGVETLGWGRYLDDTGETYLVNPETGETIDESLANLAVSVPIKKAEGGTMDDAKRFYMMQAATGVGEFLASTGHRDQQYRFNLNDIYNYFQKKGVVDWDTKVPLKDSDYRTTPSVVNRQDSIGAPGAESALSGDTSFKMSRRELNEMIEALYYKKEGRTQFAIDQMTKGATMSDSALAEMGIDPAEFKADPRYYGASKKYEQAQLNINRIADGLKTQGFDDYSAGIEARAQLNIIPRADADAELAAYNKRREERLKKNTFYNPYTGITGTGMAQAKAGGLEPDTPEQLAAKQQYWTNRQMAADLAKYGSYVKADAAQQKAEAEEKARQERLKNDSWGKWAYETAKEYTLGVAKSAIKFTGGVLQGAPVWTKPVADYIDSVFGTQSRDIRDNAMYRFGRWIKGMADAVLPTDPDYDKSFISGMIPQGAGSSFGFIPYAAGGPLGLALFSTLQMAGDSYDEAKQEGATENEAQLYARLNSGILGWTETLGFGSTWERMFKGAAGTTWKRMLLDAFREGGEETLLNEGPQAITSNVLARLTFDPNREWDKNAAEQLGAAGISAPLVSVLVSGLLHLKHRKNITQAIKMDTVSGGPAVRDFGDQDFYVNGQKVTITPELQPLVDAHRQLATDLQTGYDTIADVREKAKRLAPEQRLKYWRIVRDVQNEQAKTFAEQQKLAAEIVLQTGAPLPDVIEQDEAYEEAKAASDVITVEPTIATEPQPVVEPETVPAPAVNETPASTPEPAPIQAAPEYEPQTTAETSEDASNRPEVPATPTVAEGDAPTPKQPKIPVAGVKPTQTPVVQGIQLGKPATDAAHDAATSPENDLPEPTQAMKEAGNYRKGHLKINGLDISIENPVGSERSGKDKNGKKWSVTMAHHYGYLKRTVGADEEQIDLFVKDGTPEDFSGPVYVIDQFTPETGKFDEHKVMLGYDTLREAEAAYRSNYAKDWKGLGAITAMPFEDFKTWAREGAQDKPVGGQRGRAKESITDYVANLPNLSDKELKAESKRVDQIVNSYGHGGSRSGTLGGQEYFEDSERMHAVDKELRRRKERPAPTEESGDRSPAVLRASKAITERLRRNSDKYRTEQAEKYGAPMREDATDWEATETLYHSYFDQIEKDIEARNWESIVGKLHIGNPDTIRFFEEVTGVKLGRTNKSIEAALNAWGGQPLLDWRKADDERRAGESAERHQKYATQARDRVLAEKVRHDGQVITRREWIDAIIADGYTNLGSRKKGAINKAYLQRDTDNTLYDLKPAERDYAEEVLGKQVDEMVEKDNAEEAARIERDDETVITPEDEAHLFGLPKPPDFAGTINEAALDDPDTLDQVAAIFDNAEKKPADKPAEPAKSSTDLFREKLAKLRAEQQQKAEDEDDGFGDLDEALGLKAAEADDVEHPFYASKYATYKPIFEKIVSKFDVTAPDEQMELFLRKLNERYTLDTVAQLEPYVVKFFEDEVLAGAATEPEQTAEPAAANEGLKPGTQELINAVADRLDAGEAITWQQLDRMADAAFGGTRADGTYEPKDMYDAMEAGVVRHIIRNAEKYEVTSEVGWAHVMLKRLRDFVIDRLPTQRTRTEEQIKFQQFSTPPTIAYTAAVAAAFDKSDIVLEPSAGTGMLAVWPHNAGVAHLYANEIAPRRQLLINSLRIAERVTSVDAQFLNSLLPQEIKPTAIIMNPPFSSTGGRTKSNKTEYGNEHITQALARLADGGRLVAIVGESLNFNRSSQINFWRKVMSRYNVRANIAIPGKEYQSYGTNFGTQLVVIDKTGPTPGATFDAQIAQVVSPAPENLEGVLDAIIPIAQDRPAIQRQTASGTDLGARTGTGSSGTRGQSDADARGNADESGGRPVDAAVETGQTGAEQGGTTAQGAESRPRPGTSQPAQRDTAGETEDSERGARPVQRDNLDDAGVSYERDTERREDDDATFVRYRPAKLRGGVPHPANIVESASMAAVLPPDITYTPSIDPAVIKSGAISDLQLERIIYAGQRHEMRLPNGMRAAYFAGDGTGVGKSRMGAGIALDNWNQGRRRILMLSVNYDLLPSTKEAIAALGGNIPVKSMDRIKSGKPIDMAERAGKRTTAQAAGKDGVLFSSYATLIKDARFRSIVEWLGTDGVIIFDEAHRAKNATAAGRGKASQTAQRVLQLQSGDHASPDTRITYMSATGATDVRNMAYMTRLGLWGEGTAFPSFEAFKAAIEMGGVGAMEMVSRDMKAAGMYGAVQISMRGVGYRELEHKLFPEQETLYNLSARAWQNVLQNIQNVIEDTNPGTQARANAMTKFYGAQQRFFRMLLTALKVPTLIEDVESTLRDGSLYIDPETGEERREQASVIIKLIGTSESRTKAEVARATAAGDSLEELDFSPKGIIIEMVRQAFPVGVWTDATNDAGETVRVPVMNEDDTQAQDPELLARRDEIIRDLDKLTLPESPLDQIINHFGPDKVAEITGREKRLVRDADSGEIKYVKRAEAGVSSEMASQHEMDSFQDGRKRIAVISEAAGTGISLHAANDRQNKDRRVFYTLETGWSADQELQAMGRPHRTNQRIEPEMALLATNVGGEKRFLSTIAKRLASLGALTRGDRSASGGNLAKFDFESSYGEAAARAVLDRISRGEEPEGWGPFEIEGETVEYSPMQVLHQMGIAVMDNGVLRVPNKAIENITVGRLLNRVLALEIPVQNFIFEHFADVMTGIIDAAKNAGTFDEGVADIKGRNIRMAAEPQTVAKDGATGAETIYYQLDVDQKTAPVPITDLRTDADTGASRRSHRFYQQKRSKNIIFVRETGGRTDASTGQVHYSFRVVRPGGVDHALLPYDDLAAKYEQVDIGETIDAEPATKEKPNPRRMTVKDWWDEHYKATPEYKTEKYHIIGGALLPVWDRLQAVSSSSGPIKVVRSGTEDGTRIVGVRVPSSRIGTLLTHLGAGESARTAEQVFEAVWSGGQEITLAGGIVIKRSRLRGSPAILVQSAPYSVTHDAERIGLISELINYRPTLFVPADEQRGIAALEKLLERFPVVDDENASLKAIEGEKKPQEVVTLGEHSVPVFRNRNLDASGEAVQDATLKRLQENTGFLVGAYIKQNPKIVNADLAKELFKQFRDDPAGNDLAVHAAASALARLVFTKRLAELPKGSTVLLTAGGNAAGKSSTIDVRHADLVYDSTMSQKDGNRKMIDQVASSGHHGIIDVIYRQPADATRAMMYRYGLTGRPVTERSMAWTHHNVPKAFVEDTDAYARERGLEVNYWETVPGKAPQQLTLDEYKEKAYSEYAGVLDAIRTVIDEEIATGEYDDRSETILRPQPRGDQRAAQGRNDADEGNAASRADEADAEAEGLSAGEEDQSLKHIESDAAPVFYSGLERMIAEKMPERAPAMKESVMRGQPLFRAEEESEEDFRNVKFQPIDELARAATVERSNDRLKINLEAQEFMRRLAEEMDIRSGKKRIGDPNYEASFSGQFYEPGKVKKTIETLRDIAAMAERENVPTVAAFSTQLADEIEAAQEAGKGTLIAYMWDRRLPHEVFHQASFLGDITRSLTRRHANPLALDKHPAVKKAWDNHFSKFAEYRDMPDGIRQAVVREETAAYAAEALSAETEQEKTDGLAVLGITEEQAAEYLVKWFDSYTEKNGIESLAKFEEIEGEIHEIIQKVKEAYAAKQGGGNGEGSQSVQENGPGQEPPGKDPVDGGTPGPGGEGPQKGGRQRLRSLPATMREASLDAIDELYDIVGHDAASQRAAEILQEKGLAGSVEYLDGQKQRDGVDGRLEFLISRALQNLVHEKAETDPAEAAALDEFRQEWNREIARRRTEAGQYTESAKQADLPVANVVVTAEEMLKAKHGKDAELSAEDRLKFEDMQRDLERMFDDLAAERRKLRNEKARSKRLQDRLDGKTKYRTRNSQMARSHLVEVIREKHAKDLKADIAALQAEFRAATELVPVKAVEGDANAFMRWFGNAFMRWFGDSKVVDEDGQPLKLYHGTKIRSKAGFDTFRTDMNKASTSTPVRAVFLTPDPELASGFALNKKDKPLGKMVGDVHVVTPDYSDRKKPAVLPVYAKIEKLWDYENAESLADYEQYEKAHPYSVLPRVADLATGNWSAIESQGFQRFLTQNGYDGFTLQEEGRKNYAVFDPNNIKSAIGNRGTFDPNDPNILKAVEADTAELAPETLEKLARVGAMTLIEGIAGSEDVYLPEQFRAQMTAMFGEGIKPHMDTIYHESMRVRGHWLAEAAWDRRTKGIKNAAQSEEGRKALEAELGRALEDEELSDADVYRILDIRKDVQRKRNAIERMHRLASGYKPSATTTEMVQTIAEVAPDEAVAAAAKLFADGATKDEFYERAKALGLATDKKALHKLFVDAQEAIRAAKAAIKLNHDDAVKEVAQASQAIEAIQDAIWKARLDSHEKQKEIADEFEKLKSPLRYYSGKIYTVPMDLFNDLQATLEFSFILRQYGRNLTSEPIRAGVNQLISFATGTPYDWRADLKEQGQVWADAYNTFKSGKGFGRVVQAIEHDPLFLEALSLGLRFSVAGKIGSGQQVGEEQLSASAVKYIPLYGRVVERFDDTMAGMGDSLRMMMYRRMATALRNEGIKPETHPSEYKAIIKDINRSTGKANRFENVEVAQKVVDAVSKARLLRAINYTISNWQKIGADTKNLALATKNLVLYRQLPKGAQKQMLARAMYSYTALGLNMALMAMAFGAIVSFDPDDDDFLKFKWGKHRYDVSFGLRTELKQIFRYAAMIQRGSRVPYEMLYDTVNYSTRYGRSKLGALPGFIVDTLITGKDFKGDPVSVADWKVWVKLITPMTYMNAIETMSEHGVGATMRTMPVEMFGGGTSVYDDRVEEAKTPAEKLALKIKQMKKPWFSPTEYADRIDKETWKKVSELKARSRAGEDVKKELDALENDGKINPRIIKDVLDAKHRSILVEFMEDARLAPNERAAVEKAASPEEKQQIKEARGTLLKRMERASTDEAIKIYDEAEKRLDDAQRQQFLKMIEAKARYANDYGTLTQDERDRLARILPDLKIKPKAPKPPKPPKPSKAPALEGVY